MNDIKKIYCFRCGRKLHVGKHVVVQDGAWKRRVHYKCADKPLRRRGDDDRPA